MSPRWYLGLGSNLGDSAATISRAIAELSSLGDVVARSHLYLAPPWGRVDQPQFHNAAVALDTPLDAAQLLAATQAIEARLGRTRSAQRWGPRIIDIDILAGDDEARSDAPTVPHPYLRARAFALIPLLEIAPALKLPSDHASIAALVAALPDAERNAVVRLPDSGSGQGASPSSDEA